MRSKQPNQYRSPPYGEVENYPPTQVPRILLCWISSVLYSRLRIRNELSGPEQMFWDLLYLQESPMRTSWRRAMRAITDIENFPNIKMIKHSQHVLLLSIFTALIYIGSSNQFTFSFCYKEVYSTYKRKRKNQSAFWIPQNCFQE
jgi:hypothetical protein